MSKHTTEFITDSLEIFSLLKRIQKAKQLISLSFESLPRYALTSLLEIHHDTNVLVFDEPNPAVSNKLITAKNEAEFSLKLEQLPVSFKAEIISTQQGNNTNRLYTHFPQEIYYPQNRTYYRFRTEFIDDINTTIFFFFSKRLECELVNISLSGLCLRLPYSYASMFKVNNVINDIYIQLANKAGFSVSAKVQNTRIENNYANIVIGLQVHKQKPRIEKAIQRFIFHAERQ